MVTDNLRENAATRGAQQLTDREALSRSNDIASGAIIMSRLNSEVTFLPAGTLSAGGTTGAYSCGYAGSGVIFVNVTAITGTITATVNSSDFLSGASYPVGSSTVTAVGLNTIEIPQLFGDSIYITYGGFTSAAMSISGVFKA